jgi:transcriptional regulator with XRE-family HTH domain
MARLRRPELVAEAARRNQEHLAKLGGELRASRRRRRLTQARLGERVGVVQSTISQMERGRGGSLSVDCWQRAFLAVDRRLTLDVSLRLGRAAGYRGHFELATRPLDPARSADVGLRHDGHRLLVLFECWNVFGDIGASARSSTRKVAEANNLAVVIGGEQPFEVRTCWVVRATKRNSALVARYPEVFASRFPGSSVGWVRALTVGAEPPKDPGMIWCDVATTRVFPWRRR